MLRQIIIYITFGLIKDILLKLDRNNKSVGSGVKECGNKLRQ